MQLHGNKILITGATAGIGEALLHRFVSLGNQVIAVGRNEQKLQALAEKYERVIPFVCDVGKAEDLDRLVMQVEQEHPDTNVLINNAGVQYNYQVAEEPQLLGKMAHEVQVNYLAPLKLIALLLPTLSANNPAAIVNVTSGLGLVPKAQAPVYCGTKAGLHMTTKALRYQLPQVRVFEIIPPLVDTQMTAGRGKGKISPEQLVDEFIRAFRKEKLEVSIGKVKLLRFINRLSPALADRIMKGGV
ncbi:MAG TPA: oxidoreductase [Cytophagales bacterium]|nr:oxidoreductase [Cytophagales bacterium]